MPKAIAVNKPYPTTDDITCDAYSLRVISPAYASSSSELNTILQYVYHSYFFKKHGFEDVGETLIGIAIAEMKHLELLGETILALGAAPVYTQCPSVGYNFYSAKYVSYSCTLTNMLEDDIIGERHAIAGYTKMLKCLKNSQVKCIIERIIEDEKLHLETLMTILNKFKVD